MRAAFAAVLIALASTSATAADRVAFYYGAGRIEELARYDVVVLQPGRYAADDISRLKSLGATTVLGYVSLGEDDHLRRGNGKGPGGHASWYIDEFTGEGLAKVGSDGQPDTNADWKSYYVDPSDRRWRAHIHDQLRRIRALGMDGVFADTVLLPGDRFTDARERRMRAGMNRLVRSLKRWADGGPVWVNNGYDDIGEWKSRVDGIVIETTLSADRWFWDEVNRIFTSMRPYQRTGVRVISLLYVDRETDMAPACARMTKMGLTGSFYIRDADGSALLDLPDGQCP